MAKAFRQVDRDQQFLLPPDMAEWLPPGHLVWFVISVVDQLDLDAFEREYRLGGVGRAAFDPRMLLGLLVYAYAVGQRSSRQVERLCSSDVAFRVICAQDSPDHTTIARFRQRHQRGVAEVFAQVLGLCAKAGLGRVGVVSIDGTKIAANAAGSANRSEEWLREQASRIVAEAGEVDAAEDALFGAEARGDELPEEFTDPRTRAGRIKAALAELEAQKRAESQAEQAATARTRERWAARTVRAEADLAAAYARANQRAQRYRQAREDAAAGRGKPPDGRPPVPPEEHVRVRQARDRVARTTARRDRAETPKQKDPPATVVNLTDPDSRVMHTQKGWVQGYNAQLAVSDDQIILAAELTQQGNDINQFVPMMTRAAEAAALMNQGRGEPEHIRVVLADAGYLSLANLRAPGPDRLIAVGKRRDQERAARTEPTTGPPPPDADPIEAMAHRLRTTEDIATYRRRGVTVEPVNGHIKDRVGLRQFARRGLQAANSELQLAATTANLLKVYRATPATSAG